VSRLPRNQILIGDAAARLRELPAESVDCVITSPPYFGQRDYGHAAQLGAEPNVDGWVDDMLIVCREVARVLAPHGSFWLNVGDCFSPHQRYGALRKSLLLGPERLALALVTDGWVLRNKVIWAKTNPMPSSIRDRLSTTHELVYFLARSPQYYFDLDAIRIQRPSHRLPAASQPRRTYPPPEAVPTNRAGWTVSNNRGLSRMKSSGRSAHPLGKNPGDVWPLATAGFRDAHFATFPTSLVERPLLATCPPKVCAGCGLPWRRRPPAGEIMGTLAPACACETATRPGLVLDPFFGAGTVGVVAERYGRDWLGIELNPSFAELATDRIARARPRRYTRSGLGGMNRRLNRHRHRVRVAPRPMPDSSLSPADSRSPVPCGRSRHPGPRDGRPHNTEEVMHT
jgi:site-specific DNA-methyltransferase (adenine-specific)